MSRKDLDLKFLDLIISHSNYNIYIQLKLHYFISLMFPFCLFDQSNLLYIDKSTHVIYNRY